METINPNKCAPGKADDNGSCFTKELLVDIINIYNKLKPNDTIDINGTKEDILKKLYEKTPQCNNEVCLLEKFENMTHEKIKERIDELFRPLGPKGREWLSTLDINKVVYQYQAIHPKFLFLGTVPQDFMEIPELAISNINFDDYEKKGITQLGLVINLDESDQNGSHWVALFVNLEKFQVYYFDSVGKKPARKTSLFINKVVKWFYKKNFNKKLIINDLIKKGKKGKLSLEEKKTFLNIFDIRYNNIQHQFKNSECGVYSANFIIKMAEGKTFDDIINNITDDDKMFLNRQVFFRNH